MSGQGSAEKSVHTRDDLGVVEELELGKLSEEVLVEPFPGKVACGVQTGGRAKTKTGRFLTLLGQFELEPCHEQRPVFEIMGSSPITGDSVGGHLHTAAGVTEARPQASRCGSGAEDPRREIEGAGENADGETFLGLRGGTQEATWWAKVFQDLCRRPMVECGGGVTGGEGSSLG